MVLHERKNSVKKKIGAVCIMMIVTLTGCFYFPYKEKEVEGKMLSYADAELLAAIGTSGSSLERAREAIELRAEINLYNESQIVIYNQPASKDRIRLLTPIRIALNSGGRIIVKELVKHGADVNIQETDGKTPLMFFASRGDDLEWIELMVQYGADINLKNENEKGMTALDYAASSNYKGTEVLAFLVENGGHVDGNTVKEAIGARNPDYRKVKYLIEECEKNGTEWGIPADYTIFYLAALESSERLEKQLAAMGKEPEWDKTDRGGNTMLMAAASMGNLDTMQYLISHGADIQFISYDDESALTQAAANGQIEAVNFLMDSGYEFLPYNEQTSYHNELQAVAENGDIDMMNLLFSYDFQLKKESLDNAFSGACKNGNIEVIDLLVEKAEKQGLTIDFENIGGLNEAAYHYDIETMEHLLEKYNEDINERGGGALKIAAKHNNIEMANWLIDHGAEINLEAEGEGTPLFCAVSYGGLEMVKLFVEAGADLEQPVWNQETVTMIAANSSHRILKYLVEQGADFNKQTPEGVTSLYYAVLGRKRENVEYLLSIGVDTSPIVKDGKNAYQVAKERKDKDIVEIFLKYKKDR